MKAYHATFATSVEGLLFARRPTVDPVIRFLISANNMCTEFLSFPSFPSKLRSRMLSVHPPTRVHRRTWSLYPSGKSELTSSPF